MVGMENINAESFQPVLESLPPLAVLVLAVLVVVGAVLWLIGQSLARVACVVSGLVLGGVAGLSVGQMLAEEGAYTLPLVLGGAIAGALLAGLLFRVWMGISGAALLALAVPAASIVWMGVTPPPLQLEEMRAQVTDEGAVERLVGDDEAGDASSVDGTVAALMTTARGIYASQAEAARTWWEELGGAARGMLVTAALIGGAAGLLLGLMLPNMAASVESALVGAILMFYPGRELLARLAPDQTGWLPHTPRATLVALGLITLLGVLIQWTLLRRRTDK